MFIKNKNFLILDVYPATSAYSLRKIKSTATKSIRVRRSSDASELDIGFVGVNLDTASLISFAGSDSVFVTKWYDQSGNGNDAVQSNTSLQPRIVNAGTLEVVGSLPSIRFVRAGESVANPSLVCASWAGGVIAQPNLISTVTLFNGTVTGSQSAKPFDGGDTTNRNMVQIGGTSQKYELYAGTATIAQTGTRPNDNALHTITYVFNTNASNMYSDGVSVTNNLNLSTAGMGGITIGARVSTLATGWSGYISEIIVFDQLLNDSQRLSLEKNQGSYYNITI